MKLWVFPIEPFEERYSKQWLRWWTKELYELDIPHEFVLPEGIGEIREGEFLDVYGTHDFKARQLSLFARKLMSGEVRTGDVVLLHDGWSPAVTSLAYMRDAGEIKFKIAGIFHAGTWDPYDFLTLRGLRKWAPDIERGWFQALDGIFVSTRFHRGLLTCADRVHHSRVKIVGLPFYRNDLFEGVEAGGKNWEERDKIVVFPHRLAFEKRPEIFDSVRKAYLDKYDDNDVLWIRTKDVSKTKKDYYDVLGSSRVVFSAALQETFGIAMVEGVAMGAWPVAPKRLSYEEVLGQDFTLYETLEQAVDLIHDRLNNPCQVVSYSKWPDWEGHIEKVISECRGL